MGILETLVKKNIITDEDVLAIKKELKKPGAKLDEILQDHGVTTTDLLAIRGEFYGVPFKVLDNQGIPFEVYLISQTDFEKIAQMYRGLSGEVSQALTELETELAGDETELAATRVESGKDG